MSCELPSNLAFCLHNGNKRPVITLLQAVNTLVSLCSIAYLLIWTHWILVMDGRSLLPHVSSVATSRGYSCPAACESPVSQLKIESISPALWGGFLYMGPPRKSTITFYYGPKQSKERLCVAQKPFHPVSQQMRAKYFFKSIDLFFILLASQLLFWFWISKGPGWWWRRSKQKIHSSSLNDLGLVLNFASSGQFTWKQKHIIYTHMHIFRSRGLKSLIDEKMSNYCW